jgi:hypothetical protein
MSYSCKQLKCHYWTGRICLVDGQCIHRDEGDPDDLHQRLAQAERENAILSKKASGTLANNLCPDHRDKQEGKPCLACEVERFERKNKALDAMLDAAILERDEAQAEKDTVEGTLCGLLDRVGSLEQENATLSANACPVPGGLVGDEHGHPRCAVQRERDEAHEQLGDEATRCLALEGALNEAQAALSRCRDMSEKRRKALKQAACENRALGWCLYECEKAFKVECDKTERLQAALSRIVEGVEKILGAELFGYRIREATADRILAKVRALVREEG